MKTIFSTILERFQTEKSKIDLDGCRFSLDEINHMTKYINALLDEMKATLLSLKKISINDEIIFFKEIKPNILGLLLYFNKIHTIVLKVPDGSNEKLKEYYEGELKSLDYFFARNSDLYQYFRSNSTYLDVQYFTRRKSPLELCLDSAHFVSDPDFTTAYDLKLAKIICNGMLKVYLNTMISNLAKQNFIEGKRNVIGNLKWTGPKVALIEYGYALEASKYVNRGNADIKEIMSALELLFNIDLGDYYRSFYSIKTREDRTKYLNVMMDRLLERIDESY